MKLKDLSEKHQRMIVSALLSVWASGDFDDLLEEVEDSKSLDEATRKGATELLYTYRSFIETADSNLLEDTLKKALADTEID